MKKTPGTKLLPPPIPKHPKLTQARIDSILDSVGNNTSLYRACAKNGTTDRTWYRACADAPWLDVATTRARECAGDRDSDEIRAAAQGEDKYKGLPVDERRLIVDALKWTAARKSPKRWGDRIAVDAIVAEVPLGAGARDSVGDLLDRAAELRARVRR